MAKEPGANIIKLPNISASIPQLVAAIKELQNKGYDLPDYPEEAKTEEQKEIKERYDKIKGSAVNPVLREGNSDRRAPKAVKEYARKNPHRMGEWHSSSKTEVATMGEGDFYDNEQSLTSPKAQVVDIELHGEDGKVTTLKKGISIQQGEIVDATFMSLTALRYFLKKQLQKAKDKGVLFSLHMKATMMKVSDPIIFGQAVKIYFEEVFNQYETELKSVGANPNDGLGNILAQLEELPEEKRKLIENAITKAIDNGPALAMVNSDKGITNLHVPSDVIIDASMPAMIREGGKMWDKEGKTADTLAVIPDSSYAPLYQETIDFCKEHGAFDPTTMGTVPNVGLMAQKAEEYGSHDKTFQIPVKGCVKVRNEGGEVLMEHQVEEGDLWRMCQVKDAAIQNWVQLAVDRAKATKWPAVFWLDKDRAHDAQLIEKVKTYLQDEDTSDIELHIMSVADATRFTLERVKKGENTISVTGNVLRDYLTDLFPILELGTSAKMLSIVPLMNGGGLFETGAGGSAPKHVEQFLEENHLRWDSLGEFLALAVSLEHLGEKTRNEKALILADCLDSATGKLLQEGKSPSRKVGELDNRGSHFYLALYWAQALAEQDKDKELAQQFKTLAAQLQESADKIVAHLNEVQGKKVDINGYYFPEVSKVKAAMRPCDTLNGIIE